MLMVSGTPEVKIKIKVKVALTAKILPNDFEDFSGNGRIIWKKAMP